MRIVGEIVDVLIRNADQAQLFEIRIVEAPAPAQVEVDSIAEDVAQGVLDLTACVSPDVRLLHVFGARTRVVAIEAQRREDRGGDFVFRKYLAGICIDRCEERAAQQKHLDEVVEVPGLQRCVLPVIGEAENLLCFVAEISVLFVEIAQRAEGEHRGGRAATFTG